MGLKTETAAAVVVMGLLCIYMVMLVLERQRLEQAFKQMLGAFKDFHEQARGGVGASDAPRAKWEAVELLSAALESSDADVRQNAVVHLKRLTGQDFGEDAGAWQAWLASQPKGE